MSPGQPDPAVVRRHLLALDEAVQHLRRHAGRPLSLLQSDPDERRVVGYLSVDVSLMHRLLNSGLNDFVDFARFIEARVAV